MMWPHQSECNSFYGNPSIDNDAWQAKNLTSVYVPWQMFYAGAPVHKIRIHNKCAVSLGKVLDAAWSAIGKEQNEAARRGWTNYSGSYAFRLIRGKKIISVHSYGAAIDWDAPHNQLHSSPTDNIGFKADDPLVKAFEAEDWVWGGRWTGRSDPMHFQAAIV